MQILVACEESQAVTIALRKLGHEAYSCDLIPCSGGHPEWHIQQDVLPLLNGSSPDSFIDLAGYAACAGEIVTERSCLYEKAETQTQE